MSLVTCFQSKLKATASDATATMERILQLFFKICKVHSLQTMIWTVILILVCITLYVNVVLEDEARRQQKHYLEFQVDDHSKKQSEKTNPLESFDPFKVPNSLLDKLKSREVYEKEKISENYNSDLNKSIKKPDEGISKPNQKQDNIEKRNGKLYSIHWYNPPPYIKNKPEVMYSGFAQCQYTNCNMTFDRKDAKSSDAVIFDGRWVFEKAGFVRPIGQVWIFAAHEAPITFEDLGGWWLKPQWMHSFNWTMTYDRSNTDIFLPYGELVAQPKPVSRDFAAIAKSKVKEVLMINSHCPTASYRETFVDKLKNYISIDVLGKCGTPWNCGTHYVHDDCFNILNTTYKFFLAFENAFCNQYFSEKVFENYNYDIILVLRGGNFKEAQTLFAKHTVISTDSFKSIEGLGKYLQKISGSVAAYAELLKTKSRFYSPGYKAVYQRAMCDLCERMNNLDKYHKVIPDIREWAYGKNPCRNATDLT